MLPLRKELDDFSRACERLISAGALANAIPFTPEEIEWIAYYANELTSLADRLVLDPKPQEKHSRETMRDYARASEALLVMKNLTNDERESIKDSVADINENILDADQGQ